MIVSIQTKRVQTLEQMRFVAQGNESVEFKLADRASAYDFIRGTLVRCDYQNLRKADKGVVKVYLAKMTGLSRAQLSRLIRQHRETGKLEDRRGRGPAMPFCKRYTIEDIRVLAEVDAALEQMSGPATRAVMRRAYYVFSDERFKRLSNISNGHLYNLRKTRTYISKRAVYTKTRTTQVSIGERTKPCPDGQPGFLRVDTVHQGDLDGVKGVYLINTVDEVTQCQHIGAVPAISEAYLIPVLESLIKAYPFKIEGFHSDNGSEFINHRVANLLNKLHIGKFTKSRSRRSNDNALVEGKNGAVIRKYLGHDHIPQCYAKQVNAFTFGTLSPYLNFHRICLFPTERRDATGRIKRHYRDEDLNTPYGKFRSMPDAERFLKADQSFAELDALAHAQSDLEAARSVLAARKELFGVIRLASRVA